MRIQWIVPGLPILAFQAGMSDLYFDGTAGWCWEEATWAGQYTGPNDQLLIGVHNEMPDTLVISPEGLASSAIATLLNMPESVSIFLRCVGAPSPTDSTPIWTSLATIMPRLKGIAVLSEVEKAPVEKWAREAGYEHELSVIPLGAAVLPQIPSTQRSGVAYLGRPFFKEKGIDLLIEAAIRLPGIQFYFATPQRTEVELNLELGHRLASIPNARLVTCGIRGRAALLQQVRIVAVRGLTDWQWLPGTEIRGAHGVALASRGTPIEAWNGDGLMYFDGVDDLIDHIRTLHCDDAAFNTEAERQHDAFLRGGFSSKVVGKKLWDWIQP